MHSGSRRYLDTRNARHSARSWYIYNVQFHEQRWARDKCGQLNRLIIDKRIPRAKPAPFQDTCPAHDKRARGCLLRSDWTEVKGSTLPERMAVVEKPRKPLSRKRTQTRTMAAHGSQRDQGDGNNQAKAKIHLSEPRPAGDKRPSRVTWAAASSRR